MNIKQNEDLYDRRKDLYKPSAFGINTNCRSGCAALQELLHLRVCTQHELVQIKWDLNQESSPGFQCQMIPSFEFITVVV